MQQRAPKIGTLVCSASIVLWLAPLHAGQSDIGNSGHTAAQIQIRPWNYDPLDPDEYTRRRGVLSPGMSADGPVWNRSPLFPATPVLSATSDLERSTGPSLVHLGYSVRGVPILMHVFGRGAGPTFIFGAIHGNESNSAVLTRRLIEFLEHNPETYRGRCVAIIAAANPDGLSRDSRTNVNQIDLNRNFPTKNWQAGRKGATNGGEDPGSEPETQAIIHAVELLQPRRIVSIHSITGGRYCNNYDGPAEEIAKLMHGHNGYPVKKSIGYPTPGSFGSWAGIDRQIPTITLELPHDQKGDESWKVQRTALIAVIQHP